MKNLNTSRVFRVLIASVLALSFLIVGLRGAGAAGILAAPLAQTAGTAYYVATNGSDSNPGTLSQPFRTITKGISVLAPGSTLYIRAGTYAEVIKSVPSGTSWSAPVTIAAYPGEQVVLQPTWDYIVYIAYSRYVILDRLVIDGVNGLKAAVLIDEEAHHIRLQNSEVKNAKQSGILVAFVGSISSDYNEFINLNVHNNGTSDFDHGIYMSTSNNIIERSQFHHNAGWGIHVYEGHAGQSANNNIIRNNKSYSNAAIGGRGTGIGIYTGSGNLVYNNLVWDNAAGIAVNYNAAGARLYNNTVYANRGPGISIGSGDGTFGPATNTVVRNNILYQDQSELSNSGSGTVADHNLSGVDPRFVNAAGGDFHLQSGSPAIDAGTTLSEVPGDFDGASRPRGAAYDDGAFEFAAAAPTPTAPPPTPTKLPPTPTPAPTSTPAATNAYYVSPSGSDSNPGTITQPFRTLAKGISMVSAGKVLYLRAGTYAEVIKSVPSGTSWSAPVTIAAYSTEQVIIQPTWDYAVYIAGSRYVVLDKLIIDGVNVVKSDVLIDEGAHHIRIKNSEIKNAKQSGILVANVGSTNSDYNEFLALNVHNNGTSDFDHGIYLSTSNNIIDRSRFHHNAGWGIHVYNGYAGQSANNNIIRNNKSYSNAAIGGRGTGIGIYTGSGNLVYNNLVWDNNGGIAVNYNAASAKLYNNTVYKNRGIGIAIGSGDSSFGPATNTAVRNNIIYQNASSQLSNSGSGTVSDHNLTTDPKFVNPTYGDFHLQTGSPAINAGTTLSQVPDDFDRVARPVGAAYDIGAFEVSTLASAHTIAFLPLIASVSQYLAGATLALVLHLANLL